MRITVGEAIVKFLDNQFVSLDGNETKFVEYFYTVFGHGCVLGTGEALAMAKHGIKVLQGKNEQGMANASASYAKQSGRLKIIPSISSIGPGSANMVTSSALATVNNLPLLLFVGDTYATRRPDPVLQQLEVSESALITTNDAFRPVAKYFDRIYRPEMLMPALENAMRILLSPADTGAVVIALPQDTQGEDYDFPDSFFEKRVRVISRQAPSLQDISIAENLIKSAKRPAFIVGGGARYSGAGEIIRAISEKCGIPVLETQAGKSVVPSSFKNNFGGVGVTGNGGANMVASEADLIIAVGTRLTDFTTASKTLFSKAKIISINTHPFHAYKQDAFAVVADAKTALESFNLNGYEADFNGVMNQAKEFWNKEYARLSNIAYSKGFAPEVKCGEKDSVSNFVKTVGGTIPQTTAIALIREMIPKDSIIVGASGSLPGDLQRMWTTDSFGSYNMEYGYSTMGYEIAGAFGAKLACPEKEVYAMVGDGSYLMLNSEMVTAVQTGKKINILLFDNGGFGCINNLQTGKGINSLATEFRNENGDFLKIDFAMNARSLGFKAYTAKTMEELKQALTQSLLDTQSTLIDIKAMPKTMTNGYAGGHWHCGVTHLPRNQKQKDALKEMKEGLAKARRI
ncbi:MAG: 3D-(3,5/4)-trihydroxycyclohexane-1,2-dione acylhydrolase (decyclizing) [Firmicutes bacterium]|nr:3D-(3,5/4)-trihydroxycyclohexane-1,2-dione acylhydrolase (decyclizing) [Bacillota bacterium]